MIHRSSESLYGYREKDLKSIFPQSTPSRLPEDLWMLSP
jgi:hypothetical protein